MYTGFPTLFFVAITLFFYGLGLCCKLSKNQQELCEMHHLSMCLIPPSPPKTTRRAETFVDVVWH